MRKYLFYLVSILLTMPVLVHSQTFPGQAYSVTGNLAPIEHGNIISLNYFEQGVNVYHNGSFYLMPYVSLAISADTKGFDWNNKDVATTGVRLTKSFEHGVVAVGGGYSFENRFLRNPGFNGIFSFREKGQPVGYLQDWFGWQNTSNHKYPGSTWGAVGNLSPAEKYNLIAVTNIEQGVVLARFKRLNFVPYASLTLSGDTEKYDWENKSTLGTGLKLSMPSYKGNPEILTGFIRENRFRSGQSANGLSVQLRFWFGWQFHRR